MTTSAPLTCLVLTLYALLQIPGPPDCPPEDWPHCGSVHFYCARVEGPNQNQYGDTVQHVECHCSHDCTKDEQGKTQITKRDPKCSARCSEHNCKCPTTCDET